MTKQKKQKWKRNLVVMTAITGLGFSTFYTGLSIPVAAVEQPDQPIPKKESVSIVQLVVPNDKAKDKLLELGIDLTHRIEAHDGVYEVDAVVTPTEIAMLKTFGINVKETLITENQWSTRVAEWQSTVQLQASLAASEDTLKVLRANHFTNQNGGQPICNAHPSPVPTVWGESFVIVEHIKGIGSGNGILENDYYIKEWELPEGLILFNGDGHIGLAFDYRDATSASPHCLCRR
ncbi:hypothetical protein [Peribacillus frigoritolerans]|uniref:hypothetical protein n=1 Tax=Peribacillus frigoritolerans TaxID=450367 RepID=UPI003429B4A7